MEKQVIEEGAAVRRRGLQHRGDRHPGQMPGPSLVEPEGRTAQAVRIKGGGQEQQPYQEPPASPAVFPFHCLPIGCVWIKRSVTRTAGDRHRPLAEADGGTIILRRKPRRVGCISLFRSQRITKRRPSAG